MSKADELSRRIQETAGQIRETVAGAAVYGDPVTQDGVTVIPAARVGGGFGGGGGGGTDDDGKEGSGMGLGFGVRARPVGAWVIRDGRARWKPALDLSRILVLGCLVAIAYFISVTLARRDR